MDANQPQHSVTENLVKKLSEMSYEEFGKLRFLDFFPTSDTYHDDNEGGTETGIGLFCVNRAVYQKKTAMKSEKAMLNAVGYWHNSYGRFRYCPKPQWLVQKDWNAAELERILLYLRSGQSLLGWCGWSTCRFRRCREGEMNGSNDFTDGRWFWPEGLAHYIDCHSVMLPTEFIQTMRANNWCPPKLHEDKIASMSQNLDYTFWLQWANRQKRRRWHTFWRLAFYRAP